CNVQNISSLSDARDKQNIKELDLGIDFLMKIKPRLFNWDKREWYDDNISDGSKIKEEPTAGFIAQELDEVQTTENAEWLNLVLKDNPEKLEATPGNLLPIIVKAIQDLKKENDELKAQNVELTNQLNKFEHLQNMLVVEIEKLKTNDIESIKVSLGDQ
ncbi:MAG: tail fiber domain-containing protein, partial [Ignavibacteriaceae bacterium]|nr:tail fiber domain-containing protein [Ignavibacterium sp.]MCC6256374.1 tail fiber domain-containing protein [Ignavibacteriaceae bacterium]